MSKGFGIRALKKKQEDHNQQVTKQYFEHIVYGDNSYAVLTYLNLCNKFGSEKVRLVCGNVIGQDSILSEWRCSINTLRSETVAKTLTDKMAQLEIFASNTPVTFYKDTKFHKFGGRAKPHVLMEDEDFFLNPFININLQNLFTEDVWNSLDEKLKDGQLNKYIAEIELTDPTDLIEKTNFRIITGEFESLNCENLYWCANPKKLYNLISNKDKCDDSLAKYCSQLQARTSLVINFVCDREIYESEGTVFLPQSVTHDWGHFVADFKPFDPADKTQDFSMLMFVGDDDVTEEAIAKKIKLMKRVAERILPDFSKCNYTEHIHYDENMFITNTDDSLKESLETTHPNLKLIGQGAPIEAEDSESFRYAPRAVYSYLNSL